MSFSKFVIALIVVVGAMCWSAAMCMASTGAAPVAVGAAPWGALLALLLGAGVATIITHDMEALRRLEASWAPLPPQGPLTVWTVSAAYPTDWGTESRIIGTYRREADAAQVLAQLLLAEERGKAAVEAVRAVEAAAAPWPLLSAKADWSAFLADNNAQNDARASRRAAALAAGGFTAADLARGYLGPWAGCVVRVEVE